MKNFIKKVVNSDVFEAIAIAIMSLIVLFSVAIFGSEDAYGQNYVRQGNKFIQVDNSVKDTLVTELVIVDCKGVEHQIVINKSTGRCYTWRTSRKTGKGYRAYLRNDLSESIARELGIEFKPEKKK